MANPVLTIDGSIELTEPVELTEEEMEKIAGGVTVHRGSIIGGALAILGGALLVGTGPVGAAIGGAVISAGAEAIAGDIK